jgi:hypothetical protein
LPRSRGEEREPCDVPARTGDAGHEPLPHGVGGCHKDYGDRPSRIPGREGQRGTPSRHCCQMARAAPRSFTVLSMRSSAASRSGSASLSLGLRTMCQGKIREAMTRKSPTRLLRDQEVPLVISLGLRETALNLGQRFMAACPLPLAASEDAKGSRAGRVTAGRRVHRGSGHARGSRHQSAWRRGRPALGGVPSRWSGRREGCGLLKQVRHCYAAFACTDPVIGQNNFKDLEEPPPP